MRSTVDSEVAATLVFVFVCVPVRVFVRLCCVCGVLLESYGRIGELLLIFINSIDHNGLTLQGRGACNVHIHTPIMAFP